MMFGKSNDNENCLNMNFNNGFPNRSCTKEGPEWNRKVSTGYTGQIEQGIRNLIIFNIFSILHLHREEQ